MIINTETLYKKIGRRYVPVCGLQIPNPETMQKAGTWRMSYQYADRGTRYAYDVTPDTASFAAAAMIATDAIEQALKDAAKAKCAIPKNTKFTKKQQAALKHAREIMEAAGGVLPTTWWVENGRTVAEKIVRAIKSAPNNLGEVDNGF